jgi:hypothetical protein
MLRWNAILRNALKSVKKRALRWIAGVSPAMSAQRQNGLHPAAGELPVIPLLAILQSRIFRL